MQKNRLFYYYAKHSISFLFVLIFYMKRIILLLITITTFTNVSYASFPVVEKVSFQTTKQIEPIIESISYNKSKFLRELNGYYIFGIGKYFPNGVLIHFGKKHLFA